MAHLEAASRTANEIPPLYLLVEQLTERLKARDAVDLEAEVAAHPEHEVELRQVWPSLVVLAELRCADGRSSLSFPPGADATALTGDLGDFRILREIGRGGMGVVYEAEQISLGRRVALKVLPFAGVLDERQLQRFRNEARAAAGLHHPHIVPVYAVGCERGVHYYAMQFIEGRNLAAVLGELRGERSRPVIQCDATTHPSPNGRAVINANVTAETQLGTLETTFAARPAVPSVRTVVEWAVQAADALDYAHSVGIIHRDVKPSNLILDSRGHVWITDFGLAQFEADTGLTLSGDILGTLRYMSPEQALGQRGVVDQRADVYSLGATLYELLTLAPLFQQAGRAELVRCIERDEPRPPRRLNRTISADLETIILKAISKDAVARYATAGEFADDLRRFLDDRSVLARRPSGRERLWRWSRRRPSVAALAVVTMLSAVVLATGAIWYNVRLRAALTLAERQQQRAEDNTKKARAAVDEMLRDVSEVQLAEFPEAQRVREQLLERALEFYQGFLAEAPDDGEVRYQIARTLQSLGRAQKGAGQVTRAIDLINESIAHLDILVAQHPHDAVYLDALAQSHNDLALMYSHLYRREEGFAERRDVLSLYRRISSAYPDIPEYQRRLAEYEANFSNSLSAQGHSAEAEEHYRESFWILGGLKSNSLPDGQLDLELSRTGMYYGQFLLRANRLAEAERVLQAALAHYEQYLAGDPRNLGRRWPADSLWSALGMVQLEVGRPEEADRCLTQAITFCREWLAEIPDSFDKNRNLPRLLANRASTQLSLGQSLEAERLLRESVAVTIEFRDRWREVPLCEVDLAWAKFRLGAFLYDRNETDEAEPLLRAARDALDAACRNTPRAADVRFAMAWVLAACPDEQWRDPERAIREAQAALELTNRGCWDHWRALALAQFRAGRFAEALLSVEKCRSLHNGGDRLDWVITAMPLAALGRTDEASRWYERAAIHSSNPQDILLEVLQSEAAMLIGRGGSRLPAPPPTATPN